MVAVGPLLLAPFERLTAAGNRIAQRLALGSGCLCERARDLVPEAAEPPPAEPQFVLADAVGISNGLADLLSQLGADFRVIVESETPKLPDFRALGEAFGKMRGLLESGLGVLRQILVQDLSAAYQTHKWFHEELHWLPSLPQDEAVQEQLRQQLQRFINPVGGGFKPVDEGRLKFDTELIAADVGRMRQTEISLRADLAFANSKIAELDRDLREARRNCADMANEKRVAEERAAAIRKGRFDELALIRLRMEHKLQKVAEIHQLELEALQNA
jgi:hypothetical protein